MVTAEQYAVESQKHAWEAACFIPSASDREEVERVVRRFLELRETLNGVGLYLGRVAVPPA